MGRWEKDGGDWKGDGSGAERGDGRGAGDRR
jgi:hypothetical protein